MWTSRRCACAPGFQGDRCALQTAAHFTRNSFLHFAPVAVNQVISSVEFEFTTNGSVGVLVYTVCARKFDKDVA